MGKYVERLREELRLLTQKSSGPQDYAQYALTPAEMLLALAEGCALLALFAYVFYRSALAFLLLLPALLPFLLYQRDRKIRKRQELLTSQFREMMISVIASLQAGYSIENAFVRALEDMRLLYGADAMITRELTLLHRELHNNKNIEDVLSDFAARAHVQDIADFAEVFRIAKRSGGDLPAILKNTADLISEKIEVRREIATQISAKKMEQLIMDFVPFGIILYIDATSPGFFDALYHNLFGVLLMSVLLAVYVAAFLLSQRILRIAY